MLNCVHGSIVFLNVIYILISPFDLQGLPVPAEGSGLAGLLRSMEPGSKERKLDTFEAWVSFSQA